MSRQQLPSVDQLLRTAGGPALIEAFGQQAVTACARNVLAALRAQPDQLENKDRDTLANIALGQIQAHLTSTTGSSFKAVLNLTGTVLHTNLGRARLPEVALDAIALVARQACNLEYRLAEGVRGDRDEHIEDLIVALTGAEAATVVNNNAAAVMLTLNALAFGREVIVSRGELVEIGGSFRIPEIMSGSGCQLREVGATNRTHLKDYEQAISADTGLIMKVHTSNYAITGFTKSVSEAELKPLCQARNVPLVNDLGSGTLVDLEQHGLSHEPTVQESLAAGADLVTFSGDKLLGGPQAGIIAGRADLIARIKKNPMKRALRVDKFTLAALHAVLSLYQHPEQLRDTLPTLRYLARPTAEIAELAAAGAVDIAGLLPDFDVTTSETSSQIGSGALPTERLPSVAITIRSRANSDRALQDLAAALRALPLPVIGRLHDGALLLDCRTLDEPGELATAMAPLAAS